MNMNINLGNLKDKLFRKVSGVVYDLQSGQIGLKSGNNAILTLQKDGEKSYKLVENPLDISLALPAFAIRTPLKDIGHGDFIVADGFRGFALEDVEIEGISNPAITILKEDGVVSNQVLSSNTILGTDGILVVPNFFSGIFSGRGDMKQMLPLLLLSEGGLGSGKMQDLLPLMLISGGGDMKQMLPLLLLSEGGLGSGKMQDLLPLMLISGGGNMKMDNPLLLLALMGKDDTAKAAVPQQPRKQGWRV